MSASRASTSSISITGPDNSYHHTDQDTLDKVSVESLEKTGKLVLTFLPMLEQTP